MMEETWTRRDLPVLSAVVEAFDADPLPTPPRVPEIAEVTGLPVDEVVRALNALDDVYLSFRTLMSGGDPTLWYVERVFPAARSVVGQWPSPDTLVPSLTAALEQVAEQTADEDTRGRLRRAADALGGLAKEVAVEVVAKMAEHQIGLS